MEYPRRDSHFAHKLVRLMIRTCAAQEITANGFLLVTIIAHTEDAKRYTAPVTFWNGQLMSILDFDSCGKLDRARGRAIDAGWLHYEAGGKGKVGKYWTLIPERFKDISDGAVDCDASLILSTDGQENGRQTGDKRERTVRQTESFLPIPNPIPPETEGRKVDWVKVLQTANEYAKRIKASPDADGRGLVQFAYLLHIGTPVNDAANAAIDLLRKRSSPPDEPVAYFLTTASKRAGTTWAKLVRLAPDRSTCPQLDGTFDG